MEMFKEGIGQSSEFSTYHPIVNLIFYLFTIGTAMFSTRPLFIGTAFICAFIYSSLLGGKKQAKMNLIFMIPIVVVMAVINVFFTHKGETVLMYINGNRITAEAFLYGICAAVILTCVIVWFSSFNIIMSGDKIVYLFGKAAPVLGLTLSMIFRFIPLLKARYEEIHIGQKCMGRGNQKGFMKKARQIVKEVSILISWSLESSIETADSMEARGYGLKGRTSFHLFKFTGKDRIAVIYLMITGGMSVIGCILGKTSVYYYPVYKAAPFDILTYVTAFCYLALLIMPIYIDIRGEMKWKQLELSI